MLSPDCAVNDRDAAVLVRDAGNDLSDCSEALWIDRSLGL
jgi:hypothetical protein